MKQWARQTGFTIVELLIVVVVIAILATITIVTYNGIQQNARDSKRKNDVAQVAKIIAIYQSTHGDIHTDSGCGSSGDGSGWLNYVHPGNDYPKSIMQCLVDSGITSSVISDDKANCTVSQDCRAYMKYTCSVDGQLQTYVYANLESPSHTSNIPSSACRAWYVSTNFGMDYAVRVN